MKIFSSLENGQQTTEDASMGGRMVQVEHRPTALAVCAGGGCLDIFILIYPFSHLSPSL